MGKDIVARWHGCMGGEDGCTLDLLEGVAIIHSLLHLHPDPLQNCKGRMTFIQVKDGKSLAHGL